MEDIFEHFDTDAPDPASSFSGRLFHLINLVRSDPGFFVPFLESRLSSFQTDTKYVHKNVIYISKEGRSAVQECLEFLEIRDEEQHFLEAVSWSDVISNLCFRHIQSDSKGSGLSNISQANYTWLQEEFGSEFTEDEAVGSTAECHHLGSEDAFQVLLDLIIDDGNPERSNRSSVFGRWDYCGVSSDTDAAQKYRCSVVFVMSEHSVTEVMKQTTLMAEQQFKKEQKVEHIDWTKKKTQVSIDESGRVNVEFHFTLEDGSTVLREYSSLDLLV